MLVKLFYTCMCFLCNSRFKSSLELMLCVIDISTLNKTYLIWLFVPTPISIETLPIFDGHLFSTLCFELFLSVQMSEISVWCWNNVNRSREIWAWKAYLMVHVTGTVILAIISIVWWVFVLLSIFRYSD